MRAEGRGPRQEEKPEAVAGTWALAGDMGARMETVRCH